jgi:hypothetical protein
MNITIPAFSDRFGVKCTLQAALGNPDPFTAAAYRDLCYSVGAEWVVPTGKSSGGVSGDGLLCLYAELGLDALTVDMKALGIPREERDASKVCHREWYNR